MTRIANIGPFAWPPGPALSLGLVATLAGLMPALVALAVLYGRELRRPRPLQVVRDPQPKPPRGDRFTVDDGLTLIGAVLATTLAVQGMWRVFGDSQIDGVLRYALCAFLEVAMLASALRARRVLRERGTIGVDYYAVWAIALLSACMSAADAHGLGRALRFCAPLLAAGMWERGLASARHAARASNGTRPAIAWRWTHERLAVLLGLAEPVARSTSDVARARRLARLTRVRLRLHALQQPRPWPVGMVLLIDLRTALAAHRLRRLVLGAVEHDGLGQDPRALARIQGTVTTVAKFEELTAPADTPPVYRPAPGPPNVPRQTTAGGPGKVTMTAVPDQPSTPASFLLEIGARPVSTKERAYAMRRMNPKISYEAMAKAMTPPLTKQAVAAYFRGCDALGNPRETDDDEAGEEVG